MEIRLLGPRDAKEYKEKRLEALQIHPEAFSSSYEEEKLYPLERTENRLKDGETTFTYGAFENDRLIGVVTLILETKGKVKHRGTIVAMYVTGDYRNLGVGKALMTEAINRAKVTPGLKQVYLAVTSSNEPAKRLYLSLGFEVYGTDKRALKVGDTYYDEDLMVLVL